MREENTKHTGFCQKKNKPRIMSYHRFRKFVVNIYGKNFTLDLLPRPRVVRDGSCVTLTSKQKNQIMNHFQVLLDHVVRC